jgi:hypothetical protein
MFHKFREHVVALAEHDLKPSDQLKRAMLKYSSPLCPFGCPCDEDLRHALFCPKNPHSLSRLPTAVHRLVSSLRKIPIDSVPIWYLPDALRPLALFTIDIATYDEQLEHFRRCIQCFDPLLGILGFVPSRLRDWLRRMRIRPVMSVFLSIQQLLLASARDCWHTRCDRLKSLTVA